MAVKGHTHPTRWRSKGTPTPLSGGHAGAVSRAGVRRRDGGAVIHALRAEHPRCCLISGGEVTVTMDRVPGAGGRNQQFALACALELVKNAGEQLVIGDDSLLEECPATRPGEVAGVTVTS